MKEKEERHMKNEGKEKEFLKRQKDRKGRKKNKEKEVKEKLRK